MRRWVLAAAVLFGAAATDTGCRRTPRNRDDNMPPITAKPIPPADLEARVGRLSANEPESDLRPSNYCVDGKLYRGAPARLGRTNVFLAPHLSLDDVLLGGVVLVHGITEPSLFAALEELGPCPDNDPPPMQMRSDWLPDEGGYRTTRARLSATAAFRAHRIERIQLHEIVAVTDSVVTIRLRNPFPDAIVGELAIHHEGGPGKPMPHYARQPLAIPVGGHLDVAADRRLASDRPGGRPSKLASLDIAATAGPIQIDLAIVIPN